MEKQINISDTNISSSYTRQPFLTHCFSLVVIRHSLTNKFLCVKETRNRGWWLCGGLVNPGEDFESAAHRETFEEANIEITLKGILRIEHSLYGHQTARMRVVFYAESTCDLPKQISDSESEEACWFTISEIIELSKMSPGLRSNEVIEWPIYIQNGGTIAPLSLFQNESQPIVENKFINFKVNADEFTKALINEDVGLVSSFLASGFNPNLVLTNKNWTGLHFAIKTKNEKLVKMLLLAGADPLSLTAKNRNCFHFAVQSGKTIVKMLCLSISDLTQEEQSEAVNMQDVFGDCPLHVLARHLVKYDNNDFSVFEFLVEFGADENLVNLEGVSPLQIIQKHF